MGYIIVEVIVVLQQRLVVLIHIYVAVHGKSQSVYGWYVMYRRYRSSRVQAIQVSLPLITRLHMMYEKAKVDRTIRTDIPESEFMRVTVHSMMTACAHYAEGFIWGSDDNKDYTDELIMIKEMILDYATKGIK